MYDANPPQLHSNLKFIALYRRQAKFVSEEAYYFTNLVSAKSFIYDLDAKSLSIDDTEFQESMQAARLASRGAQIEPSLALDENAALTVPSTRMHKLKQIGLAPKLDEIAVLLGQADSEPSVRMHEKETCNTDWSSYPFMEAEAGELTVGDVERLLSLYKDVVKKYTNLCRAFGQFPISQIEKINLNLEGYSVLAQPEEQKVDEKKGE
ncbi:unnamed protein product [Ilex paraguariensis]|uniref:VPS9 domain-containing protein n=1 Tax=Ilex paraguariensis TaxID=185542 RepID=A0ABC8UPK4_9AQUA